MCVSACDGHCDVIAQICPHTPHFSPTPPFLQCTADAEVEVTSNTHTQPETQSDAENVILYLRQKASFERALVVDMLGESSTPSLSPSPLAPTPPTLLAALPISLPTFHRAVDPVKEEEEGGGQQKEEQKKVPWIIEGAGSGSGGGAGGGGEKVVRKPGKRCRSALLPHQHLADGGGGVRQEREGSRRMSLPVCVRETENVCVHACGRWCDACMQYACACVRMRAHTPRTTNRHGI